MSLRGVFNGKTLAGAVVLGVAFVLHVLYTEGAVPGEVLPGWLATVLGSIGALLTFFGVHDSAEQTFEDWKAALKSFMKTNQFFAVMIFFIGEFVANIGEFTSNPVWLHIAHAVATALAVFGLKKDGIKARLNMSVPSAKHQEKYAEKVGS